MSFQEIADEIKDLYEILEKYNKESEEYRRQRRLGWNEGQKYYRQTKYLQKGYPVNYKKEQEIYENVRKVLSKKKVAENASVYFIPKTVFKREIIKQSTSFKIVRKPESADYIIYDNKLIYDINTIAKNIQYLENHLDKLVHIDDIVKEFIFEGKTLTYDDYVRFKNMIKSEDSKMRAVAFEKLSDYKYENAELYFADLYSNRVDKRLISDKSKKHIQMICSKNDYYSLVRILELDIIRALQMKMPQHILDQYIKIINNMVPGYTFQKNEAPQKQGTSGWNI